MPAGQVVLTEKQLNRYTRGYLQELVNQNWLVSLQSDTRSLSCRQFLIPVFIMLYLFSYGYRFP